MSREAVLTGWGPPGGQCAPGDEALKFLLENDVAVILLDVNMPGMDGLETATYIRMRHKTAHTPIIFLTAYAEREGHGPAIRWAQSTTSLDPRGA